MVQSRHGPRGKLFQRRLSSLPTMATRPTKKPCPRVLRPLWDSRRFSIRPASIWRCLYSPKRSQRLTRRLDGDHVGFELAFRFGRTAYCGTAGQTVLDRGGRTLDGPEPACGWEFVIAGDLEEVCDGSEGEERKSS